MEDQDRTLRFRLIGDTSGLSRSLKNAEGQTKGLSSTMGKLGGVIAAAFTVRAIGGFIKSIATVGMDFESQMTKVRAISSATAEEFEALKNEASRLGSETKFTATQAGEGLEYFAMAGWKVEDSIAALEPTLQLAIASGTDLGITADIVSDAMTAFKMEAKDAGKFTDLLAQVSRKSNTNVQILGESFKYAAPLMGSLGVSAEDTALALGLMANAGIKGTVSGNMLKTSVANMMKPTKEMSKTMEEIGLKAQFSADGSMDLKGTLDNLRSSFSKLTPQQSAAAAATIFGKDAMGGMLAIVNETTENYDTLSEATKNYEGTGKEMADMMRSTMKGSIESIMSSWEKFKLLLYDVMRPAFFAISVIIEKVVARLIAFAEAMKENMGKSNGDIKAFMGFFIQLKDTVLLIFNKMKDVMGSFYEKNKETIDKIIEKFKIFVIVVTDVLKMVGEAIGFFIDIFGEYFLDQGLVFIELFLDGITRIVKVVQGVMQVLKGIFTGDWALMLEGAKSIFEGAFASIRWIFEGVINLIINQINGVLRAFNKVQSIMTGKSGGFSEIKSIGNESLSNNPGKILTKENNKKSSVVNTGSSFNNQLAAAKNGGNDNRDVVLKIGESEFARVAIKSLNNYGRQTGVSLLTI